MRPRFEEVWRRITALEGETFVQIRGGTFSFRVVRQGLDLDRTNQTLTRSQVKQAYELTPLESTVQVQHLRGPSYLYAILMDLRVRQSDW